MGKNNSGVLTDAGLTYFERKHFARQLEAIGVRTSGHEFMDLAEMSEALVGTKHSYVIEVLPSWQALAVREGHGRLVYVPGATDKSHDASRESMLATLLRLRKTLSAALAASAFAACLREYARTIEDAEREQRNVTATASVSVTDAYFMEAGKRSVVEKCIGEYWAKVKYDEETDTYQTFESWCDKNIDRKDVPDCMSLAAFRDACDKQLREVYDEKLAEAIKEGE